MTTKEFKSLKVGDFVYVPCKEGQDYFQVTKIDRLFKKVHLVLGGKRSFRFVHKKRHPKLKLLSISGTGSPFSHSLW